MREPIDRQREKTTFTVLKVILGCGLFLIVMCAGLVFFLHGLCKSGKVRLSQAEQSEVRVVRSWP